MSELEVLGLGFLGGVAGYVVCLLIEAEIYIRSNEKAPPTL